MPFRSLKTLSEEQQWRYVEYMLLAAAAIPILLVLRAFFSTDMVSGWDMEPQYHLVELMVGDLREGRITGYDRAWFAGYPAFTFYGPFTYILAAAPSLLSADIFPPAFGLHIIIIALPFLYLWALRFTTKTFFGSRAGCVRTGPEGSAGSGQSAVRSAACAAAPAPDRGHTRAGRPACRQYWWR